MIEINTKANSPKSAMSTTSAMEPETLIADLKVRHPNATKKELKELYLQEIARRLDQDEEFNDDVSLQTQPIPATPTATPQSPTTDQINMANFGV